MNYAQLISESPQIAALKKYIFGDGITKKFEEEISKNCLKKDLFIIFLSICNAKERALVINGTGATLESAWENACKKAESLPEKENYNIVWAKADIVNSTEEILTTDLNMETTVDMHKYFYRKGIALDSNFDTAFLEAELNGYKMIEYYKKSEAELGRIEHNAVLLKIDSINRYLKKYYRRRKIKNIPDKITVFTATGFFCGENGDVHELYDKGLDYGRRVIDRADSKTIEPVIISAFRYLAGMIQPDGKFIYGYYPIFYKQMTSYNILRHAGSVWNLINICRTVNDSEIITKINAAANYLIDKHIEYKEDNIAYVIERKNNEIKLGGNALAVIMLTEYMDVFKTDKYTDIVRHLTNGILELENLEKGTFYHVLNFPDYSPKDKFRTIYYDGEATFALTRAYTFTKDERYLHGAKMAVENFIAEDYTQYKDQWIAYAMNEITKYKSDISYYEFAMKNAVNNLKKIYDIKTTSHIHFELLMAGWQTYKRMTENSISSEYLDTISAENFAKTIYYRAKHMLNGYFYPEFAMYMKYPDKIANTFFIRQDNFRVRIDDIQHFIGGYYLYSKYYDDIYSNLNIK